ncbi:MAG: recombination mediator RecR [Thermodesulfobacteriota bacterium]
MPLYAKPVETLIRNLTKLPGIGEKSATRLALFILRSPAQEMEALARAIVEVKRRVKTCPICFNFTDVEPCAICSDPSRDTAQICVVEDPADLVAIEASQGFRGRYHVLHGVISPLDGLGPQDIRSQELVERVRQGRLKEVILAMNPSVEGEATSLYLAQILKPLGVRVTRIAYGLPAGGDVQYADRVTLGKALENRREL